MGKLIEQKYSDISHKIIKKHAKKDPFRSLDNAQSGKRKLPSINDDDEPHPKTLKTGLVNIEVNPPEVPTDPTAQELNESTPKTYAVQNGDNIWLETDENNSKDLFLQDELLDSYHSYTTNDFGFQILDEICLEGLDGITIEAFWKRLSTALRNLTFIRDDIKESIWRFIRNKSSLQFFKLVEPRGVLEIYDRMQYVDPDVGVVMEPICELPDIYPHALVTNPNVQGSCSTFDTRKDITADVIHLDLKSAEQIYSTSLVIVASQKLRKNALFYESSDPTAELMNMDYCFLERIGRSRKHGELTQGNVAVTNYLKIDPKSSFHYQKQLVQYNLLAKQSFYIKSMLVDQNKTGKLLHLRRFFHKIKPKQMLLAEQIINVIKQRPECRIEVGELRRIFERTGRQANKIMKSPEFRKFAKTTLVVYRDLYPDAAKSEYMRKSKPTEKFIKCKELINPYLNVSANWSVEQEDSDNENEEEEEITGGKFYNMECFKQVYYHILSKGKQGCTLGEIQNLLGMNINIVRMCIKKLLTRSTIMMRKLDRGKQRYILYYASCLDCEEDIKINLNPGPPEPCSSIADEFRKRKREVENLFKAVPSEVAVVKRPRDSKPKLDIPKFKCAFFIRVAQELDYHPYDDNSDRIRAKFNCKERDCYIKLNAAFPRREQLFEINKLLNEITSSIQVATIKINFESDSMCYTSNPSVDFVTKVILLKAALGEAVINASTLNCFTHKRRRTDTPALLDTSTNKATEKSNNPLQYMGPEPVTVFTKTEDNVTVEIVVSTPPKEFKDDSSYPALRQLSERVISRIRIILGAVYDKMICEDIFKLIKVVEEEELKQGYKKKMDRKSLARILRRLVDEGYVKIFKLFISNDKITKTQTFGCHPSVCYTDTLIQSACQQLKWKYFIGTAKKTTKANVPALQSNIEERMQTQSPFNQSDVMNSILQMTKLEKMKHKELSNKPCRGLPRRGYGFKPKFVRMRIIHEFLFYLIYGCDRNSEPLSQDEVEDLFESYCINVTKDDLKNIPSIYCKEISWKMFIPPLPHHADWMTGWALLCDVILRLPISVLCKIHNVRFEVPELTETLNHPIKRFYLVKDLPESIREPVLFKRKYLFDIHESICRLCWCGLLQFGPQKYKEKDQVFIYLNRMASLLDTTTTEPGYNKVSNKEYKKLAFFFNSPADIESYWFNTYGICLSTKLNAKLGGQLVTIFDPQSRPELSKALRSKTPEEALQDDNGEMPGDKRGAAGFDSSLWSHIMRNWFWATQKRRGVNKAVVGLRQEKLEKITPTNLSYDQLHTLSQSNKVFLPKKTGKQAKAKPRKCVQMPVRPSKTTKKITRRIPMRRKTKKRKYLIDHVDVTIVKKLGVQRIKWTPNEDKKLALCLAANILLNAHPSKQVIPYTVVRDVLHRSAPESRDKTSRACQRRLKKQVLKKYHYVKDNALNLLHLKPIGDYYTKLINDIKNRKSSNDTARITEAQLTVAFIILMSHLLKHEEEALTYLQGNPAITNYLSEEQLEFTENNLITLDESAQKFKYRDAENDEEIKRDVLKSVIHSSLGCKGKPGVTFQLFRIYQKYPDYLISESLDELRRGQAISFNRFVKKSQEHRWSAPFQLSNLYIFSQSSTFGVTTSVEAYKTFLNVQSDEKFLDFTQETVASKKYGQLLGLNEFCTFWQQVEFKFYLPRTTVILNPHIKDHGELVDELALRWQSKLKKILQDNVDADIDQENENENSSKSQDADVASTSKEDAASDADHRRSFPLSFMDDNQTNPLNLTVETGNSQTIDRLKTWVTDCMEADKERRSPSPEFIDGDNASQVESARNDGATERCDSYDEVDKISTYSLRKAFTRDQIPTLDEIKEGMLKYTSTNEERIIPHITDLCSLLNKDCSESNLSEEKLERLKSHFITQYAFLEDLIVEDVDQLRNHYMVEYIESKLQNRQLWDKITSNLEISRPGSVSEVYSLLLRTCGNCDVDLVDSIIKFVEEKEILGATAVQIKECFGQFCMLEATLQALVDTRIFVRVGICSVTFVHYTHQSPWIIETFTLSTDEQLVLEEQVSSQKDVRENIEKQLQEKKLINTYMMPWIKVDGALNEDVFKTWLCNVASHCFDNPGISFVKLCEKFCYIKPVDIFYLLEILRDLGCIELLAYEGNEQSLFSSNEYVFERGATFLDNFDNIYIAPNNVSMTRLGSFLYQNNLV
ncbi:hypothetical protein NQ315_002421 [Exocentrus adspersus]|uniref:General transcription factor 3C polypeptide 1 n=1 Tax=Exocentrus adspersus TaxID=1586481 RepID=A0AAV8VTL0_9CUCU|nr:hypothetical protein NQ315_002421 [Exocentrus adspersus]